MSVRTDPHSSAPCRPASAAFTPSGLTGSPGRSPRAPNAAADPVQRACSLLSGGSCGRANAAGDTDGSRARSAWYLAMSSTRIVNNATSVRRFGSGRCYRTPRNARGVARSSISARHPPGGGPPVRPVPGKSRWCRDPPSAVLRRRAGSGHPAGPAEDHPAGREAGRRRCRGGAGRGGAAGVCGQARAWGLSGVSGPLVVSWPTMWPKPNRSGLRAVYPTPIRILPRAVSIADWTVS